MSKFVELPSKTPFFVNVDNIEFVRKDVSGITILFTSGTSKSFALSYDEVVKLLKTTD